MCLEVDKQKTQKFKDNHPDNEQMVVWKVYKIKNDFPYPPLKSNGVYISPGSICSNRPVTTYPFLPDWEVAKNTNLYSDSVGINYAKGKIYLESGIHVCMTRESARKYKKSLDWTQKPYHKTQRKNYVIFKCSADSSNLVAFGKAEFYGTHKNCAVFTKIYIHTADWHKALKKDFR